MGDGSTRPFVSVKFSPVGRTYSFLMPELDLDNQGMQPGEQVVVQTASGPAIGTVQRPVTALAPRRSPSDAETKVLRRATRDDVVTRLKHQQREQEAHRICLLKIKERGLSMKLARVEQLFDGSRLIF
jgi:cell fate regulator YaaT (PSP1 superfamily)